MSTSARMQTAEAKMFELIDQAGLPMPNEVEYGETEIRLLWTDAKVAVVVELDDLDDAS